LLPVFRAKTGIELRVIAVGSGQAMEIGRRGDADVILTHDPSGEERFVAEGFGTSRTEVMSSDFVLVGPPEDRAGAGNANSGSDAFNRVAENQAVFVSRGDESGTHQKEKATWTAAGIEPAGGWYMRSGQGMGAVLRMADEKRGYALSDRGTFISQRDKLQLIMVYSGDPTWINQYAVIPVNPDQHPHIKHDLATQFAEFLVSNEAQLLIADFGRVKYGEPLFRSNPRSVGVGR
jgi:tungstate transport system substrate-binding protein